MISLGLNLWSTTILARGGSAADLYAVGGTSPELVFDFSEEFYRTNSTTTTFDDAMTFSRDGRATMVDSDGLLKWAPHNLLPYSEDFSNAAWTKSNVTVVATSATLAPNGTTTAYKLIENSGVSSGRLLEATYPDQPSTFAVFAKAAEWGFVQLGVYNGASYDAVYVDLSDGSIVRDTTDGASVTSVGNGWYLVSAPYADFNVAATICGGDTSARTLNTGDGTLSGAGDGTSGIYIWGAHLYRSDLGGMVANPDQPAGFETYVPTTSAARYLPRRGHHIYNGAEWVNEGVLVESEQRVNLAYYSNDISNTAVGWTANNTITAPATGVTGIDGVSGSPFKLIAGSGGTFQARTNQNSVTTGQNYALCAILKDAGDGVYAGLAGVGIETVNEVPIFDLVNGVVDKAATTTVVKDAGIEPWGDGWYFCWARVTAGGASGVALSINTSATDNTASNRTWTGDNTSGYYVAYVGVEQTSGMPSIAPIPTSGSTVTRAADTITVPSANLPWPTPNVIGPELVTNGTFNEEDGVDGWVGVSPSPVLSVVSGRLRVTGVGGGTQAYTVIPTTAGKVYKIDYEGFDGTGAFQLKVGTAAASSDIFVTNAEVGPRIFVALSDTTYVTLRNVNSTTGSYIEADNISVREIDPLAVSIQMQGTATGNSYTPTRWYLDANNAILQDIGTTDFTFTQEAAGVVDTVTGGSFTSGVNTPFNFASTHASTLLAAAVGGTALTDNTTPTALADLSSTNLQLAYDMMGTVKLVRIFAANIGQAGREEASA